MQTNQYGAEKAAFSTEDGLHPVHLHRSTLMRDHILQQHPILLTDNTSENGDSGGTGRQSIQTGIALHQNRPMRTPRDCV